MEASVSTTLTTAYGTQEERAAAQAMPPADRQDRLETMLVDYPHFTTAVAAIRGYHMPIDGGRPVKGEICGIIGEPRAGKSCAIRHYKELCGNTASKEGVVPKIVYVDVQDGWTSADLAEHLYRAVGFSSLPKLKTQALFDNVVEEIGHFGVEMVVIDDAQWVLTSRDTRTVKHSFGFIVGLAERKICNVLLAGTEEVAHAVRLRRHARGRGSFPKKVIKPYDWTSKEDQEDFLFMLQSIDDRLPFLEYSGLASPAYAAHFFRVSGGLIGLVMNYVKAAARAAINDGSSKVEGRHLIAAAEERRDVGDAYAPFVGAVDDEDPAGKARAERKRLADEAAEEASRLKRLK